MVRHDVAGTVRQEQIVQYIQHINPVHTTNVVLSVQIDFGALDIFRAIVTKVSNPMG